MTDRCKTNIRMINNIKTTILFRPFDSILIICFVSSMIYTKNFQQTLTLEVIYFIEDSLIEKRSMNQSIKRQVDKRK